MLTVLEEYISGIALEEHVRSAPLTPEEVLACFSEHCRNIAQRLRQDASAPIIHRDIKPSNIMLTSCGHLVLLDFNAAKSFAQTGSCRYYAARYTGLCRTGTVRLRRFLPADRSVRYGRSPAGNRAQSFADTAAGRHSACHRRPVHPAETRTSGTPPPPKS